MGSMQTNSSYIQQNKITSLKQYPRHMITYILSMLACPDCSYMLMHLQCRSNITLMYKIITHVYYMTTDYRNTVQCLSFVRCWSRAISNYVYIDHQIGQISQIQITITIKFIEQNEKTATFDATQNMTPTELLQRIKWHTWCERGSCWSIRLIVIRHTS